MTDMPAQEWMPLRRLLQVQQRRKLAAAILAEYRSTGRLCEGDFSRSEWAEQSQRVQPVAAHPTARANARHCTDRGVQRTHKSGCSWPSSLELLFD